MQAIILAGGSGTRLRPLTYTTPKPMLPIGGRPAILRLVTSLAEAGIDEVFVTTNYLAEVIEEGLRAYSLPVPVHCIREQHALGTAGCVKNAIDKLGDEFLIIQGDAVADVDYERLLKFHADHKADVTITAIRVSDPREFGILATDSDGRISRFQEKPRLEDAFSDLANAGFYVAKKSVFDAVPKDEPFDFSKQLFPILMKEGKRFFAFELDGYWVDIGRPQTYLEGNRFAIAGCGRVAPDAEVADDAILQPPFIIEAGSQVGAGAIIGPQTIIGRGCRVGAGAEIAGAVLFDDVAIGEKACLQDCIVASRSHIGARAKVGSLAVIGEGCDIGADAEVAPYSRVGPITPVSSGTVVEGVVSPRLDRLGNLQRAVVHAPGAADFDHEQRLVYGLLAEFGELTLMELTRISGLEPEPVQKTVGDLEKNGLILSTTDYPRRYALTREVPTVPRRILFIDDVPDTCAIYSLALTMHGFDVQVAQSGEEAIRCAELEVFDAIITDLAMPNMDGFATIEGLRKLEYARQTPIMICSAHGDDETRRRARDAGAEAVLQKPILPQELLMRLGEMLRAS